MTLNEIRRVVFGAVVVGLIPAFVACGEEEETETDDTETAEESDSEEAPAE